MNNKYLFILIKSLGWILVIVLCFITFLFTYEIINNKFNLNNNLESGNKNYILVNLNEDVYFKINTTATNHRIMRAMPNDKNNSSSEDKTTDVVSNAMAAIGTAVGVITLILSFGIPIFYEKIQLINQKIEELKNTKIELVSTLSSINTKENLIKNFNTKVVLQSQLIVTKNKLLDWAIESSDVGSGISFAQRIGFYLEFLQSEDDEVRFNAFGELMNLPLDFNSELEIDKLLIKDLIDYQNACHNYICKLKGIPEKFMPTTTHIWCKFFDEIEITCFVNYRKNKYSKSKN